MREHAHRVTEYRLARTRALSSYFCADKYLLNQQVPIMACRFDVVVM
jgi:hypothetical protein